MTASWVAVKLGGLLGFIDVDELEWSKAKAFLPVGSVPRRGSNVSRFFQTSERLLERKLFLSLALLSRNFKKILQLRTS